MCACVCCLHRFSCVFFFLQFFFFVFVFLCWFCNSVFLRAFRCRCVFLLARARLASRWMQAVEAASALAKLSDTRGLAPQYARLLLELSRARLGAEPSSPVGALPHALRCLAVCESYSLDAIHASAMTHLAEVYYMWNDGRPEIFFHPTQRTCS